MNKKIYNKSGILSPAAAGYLLAVGATVIWSWNYIIARGIHESVPPVTLAFFRWSVATVFIIPVSIKSFLRERDVVMRNIPYFVLTSFLGITLFNTLVYIAGHTTGAINLSLIAITTPVFIIIIEYFNGHEKIGIRKSAGIAITIYGILMLISRGSVSSLLSISFSAGDLWMLAAAAIFAVYSVLVRKRPEGISTKTFLFAIFIPGLAMLLPFYLAEYMSGQVPVFSTGAAVSVLYIGLFASIAAYFMWNTAIDRIGPATSGIIYYSLPVFSTLWASLFLGEIITPVHIISTALVISGIVMATYRRK